jgi:hypothetical protein
MADALRWRTESFSPSKARGDAQRHSVVDRLGRGLNLPDKRMRRPQSGATGYLFRLLCLSLDDRLPVQPADDLTQTPGGRLHFGAAGISTARQFAEIF